MLDGADLEHEVGELHRVLGCEREAECRVVHELEQAVDRVLVFRHAQVEFGRSALVAIDPVRRLLKRSGERGIRLWIFFAEFACRPHDEEGSGAAKHVVGVEDRAHARALEFEILKRRRREMAGDLAARQKRRHAVGVREIDGQWVEFREICVAKFAGDRHLQHDCVYPRFRAGEGDFVLFAVIADGPDRRVACIQEKRHRRQRPDRFHVEIAARARPQGEKGRHAAGRKVQAARQQCVVHDGACAQRLPRHRDVLQPLRLDMFFDELVLLHHHQREIADAETAGDFYFRDLGVCVRCRQRERAGDQYRFEQGGHARHC